MCMIICFSIHANSHIHPPTFELCYIATCSGVACPLFYKPLAVPLRADSCMTEHGSDNRSVRMQAFLYKCRAGTLLSRILDPPLHGHRCSLFIHMYMYMHDACI